MSSAAEVPRQAEPRRNHNTAETKGIGAEDEDLLVTSTLVHTTAGGDDNIDSAVPSPFPITCTAATVATCSEEQQHGHDSVSPRQPPPPPLDDITLTLFLAPAWNLDKRRRHWKPTLMQRQTWSILMNNNNLVALAPTSSGKTLAYGIPMLCQKLAQLHQQQTKTTSSSNNRHRRTSPHHPIVGLVLVPTRELCAQVAQQLGTATRSSTTTTAPTSRHVNDNHERNYSNSNAIAIYGGVDRDDQVIALRQQKPSVVVATPGRLVDILQQLDEHSTRTLFSFLRYVVLDEADRLAMDKDMAEQVNEIFQRIGIDNGDNNTPATGSTRSSTTRQQQPTIALFSATAPRKAQTKWREWIGPTHIRLSCVHKSKRAAAATGSSSTSNQATTANNHSLHCSMMSKIPEHLAQMIHVCNTASEKEERLWTTLSNISKTDGRQRSLVIVFFREIKTLIKTSKRFASSSLSSQQSGKSGKKKKIIATVAECLHGKMSQAAREQALQNFRSGKVPILFATDICARGIHIPNVWYIINYDIPDEMEQYVHRCGRAARNATLKQIQARPPATVYSFVSHEQTTTTTAINPATNIASSNTNKSKKKGRAPMDILAFLRCATNASTDDPTLARRAAATTSL
jgi:superfamily II DNA/RNA helicase